MRHEITEDLPVKLTAVQFIPTLPDPLFEARKHLKGYTEATRKFVTLFSMSREQKAVVDKAISTATTAMERTRDVKVACTALANMRTACSPIFEALASKAIDGICTDIAKAADAAATELARAASSKRTHEVGERWYRITWN